jgi:hypothetical protein
MRVVVNHLSLDGVMQGPGRPDEDTRNGFRHGGWAQAAASDPIGAALGQRLGEQFSWLFGRVSLFLMIHPLVLGSGQPMFGPDHDLKSFTLVESDATATGVILATYRPSSG